MPLPGSVHHDSPIPEKRFHIVQRGDKWCLLSKTDGSTLGCHPTKDAAEAQERAIQANKHSWGEISVAKMREICPACADKMEAKRMRSLKLDFSQKNFGLSPQALSGLCDHFGDQQGFRTRCMDSKGLGEGIGDMGAFCNWLKDQCFGTVKDAQVASHATDGTKDIKGVEIFAVGQWNGDEYTLKDLDQIVSSFEETKDYLKPYLKLGHSDDQQLLAEDSLPAAGWISNVYRKGSKLLADFCDMPSKIYDLVKKKAYARVSSEIFMNIKVNGKDYAKALKAVALLGGETPAVQTLEDIHALYAIGAAVAAYANKAEVREYEFDSALPQEVKMDPVHNPVAPGAAPAHQPAPMQKEPDGDECYKQLMKAHGELDMMRKQMAEMEPKQKAMQEEMSGYKQKCEVLSRDLVSANAELTKIHAERRADTVKTRVNNLIGEKKIMPSQAPALEAVLMHAMESNVKKFKLGEKDMDLESIVMQFVENGSGGGLPTQPRTDSGVSASIDPENGESVHQAVLKHMADNKVNNYTLAYKAVIKALKDKEPKK